MTLEELEEVNRIRKEINRLEDFLYTAERVWKGKLTVEKQKYILESIAYGFLESKSIELDNDMKNKVLKLFRDRVNELKKSLEAL